MASAGPTDADRRERSMRYARKVGVKLPLTKEWLEKVETNDQVISPTAPEIDRRMSRLTTSAESRELNILLLGETGVGKSTFINGIVNYVTYSTLSEAEQGKPVSLIPSRFTLMDDNYQQRVVVYGADKNEVAEPGQSATQMPITYTFKEGNLTLNIIDTPGVGDTRGLEQDKKNVQYILQHIANFENLHGICILMRPNNARLNVMFRFCIQELLRQLHRDACKNMIICFTFSRSTLFRPGDTLTALEKLLSEDESKVAIKLTNDNMFCFDNEAVKFLMAVKNGVKFGDADRKSYEESWNRSVDEAARLFDRVASLKPHTVKYTVSLNEVRTDILSLSRPVVEICKVLLLNIDAVNQKKADIMQEVNTKRSELTAALHTPIIDLVAMGLESPRVVCTSAKCIRMSQAAGQFKLIEYVTVCCNDCDVDAAKDQIGNAALQQCDAIQPNKTACKVCSCPWNVHMMISYNLGYKTQKVTDDIVQRIAVDKVDKEAASKAVRKQLELLNVRLQALVRDQEKLLKTCAQFTGFLKRSTIVAFNDPIIDYFNHVIDSEKVKCDDGGMPERVRDLGLMRSKYAAELASIDGSVMSSDAVSQLDGLSVQKLIISLSLLPIAGPMLTNVMEGAKTVGVRIVPVGIQTEIKSKSLLLKAISKLAGIFSR